MREGVLARLARFVAQRARAMLLLGTLLAALAAVLGLPPRIDSGALRLFPNDDGVAAELTRVGEQNGGAGAVYLVFEGDDPERMGPALDQLAQQLAELDSIRFALHRFPDDIALHVGLMQLDPQVMSRFADRLERAAQLGSALNPFLAQRILQFPEARAELEQARGTTLLFPDDELGRIFAKPVVTHHAAQATRRTMRAVRQVVAQAEPQLRAAGVRLVTIVGPYANFAAGLDGVASDLVWTSAVSVVLVLGVLMVGLRSVSAPLMVFPPLVLAALMNLAFLGLAFGAVNNYTSIGNALLVGLGIDVAVHLLGRYREARAQGLGLHDALALAWDRTGPACITAGLTSAAGFLTMGWFRFGGLSELGYSLAFGMLSSLAAMLVFLPALIATFDRSTQPLLGAQATVPTSSLPPRRPPLARVALAGALLLTALVSGLALPRLEFNYDFTAVGRDDLTYSLLDDAGRKHMRDALPPVVVTLDDPAELPAEHARLQALVDGGEMPMIKGILSLETLLPHDQAQRVTVLRRIRDVVRGPNARYLPAAVQQSLAPIRDWEPRVRTSRDLPDGLVDYFVGGRRILMLAQGDLYDMRESTRLLEQVSPHVDDPASDQLLQAVLLRVVFDDLPRVGLLALLAVALLTALDLRRPAHVVAVVGSLAAGVLWSGSLAGLFGLRINLGNIVALPILLGIGIDVVVHLAHRLRREGRVGPAYRTVGVAAVLSTLTTVASFVALMASGSGGARSLGQLVVLGLLTTTTTSAAVLALAWGSAREGRA